MRAIVSDDARLQRMLDVEAALARAEAGLGVIPSSAAKPITDACKAKNFDIKALGEAATAAGNLAIPVFKALTVETEGGDPVGSIGWRPLGLITLAVVVFGLALPRLGLILTLPILILIASFAGDEFRLKEVIVNFIVLTLGSWAIFIKGLNLVIPLWPAFMTA